MRSQGIAGRCRICGCTEWDACLLRTERGLVPCSWVKPGLCNRPRCVEEDFIQTVCERVHHLLVFLLPLAGLGSEVFLQDGHPFLGEIYALLAVACAATALFCWRRVR